MHKSDLLATKWMLLHLAAANERSLVKAAATTNNAVSALKAAVWGRGLDKATLARLQQATARDVLNYSIEDAFRR